MHKFAIENFEYFLQPQLTIPNFIGDFLVTLFMNIQLVAFYGITVFLGHILHNSVFNVILYYLQLRTEFIKITYCNDRIYTYIVRQIIEHFNLFKIYQTHFSLIFTYVLRNK